MKNETRKEVFFLVKKLVKGIALAPRKRERERERHSKTVAQKFSPQTRAKNASVSDQRKFNDLLLPPGHTERVYKKEKGKRKK